MPSTTRLVALATCLAAPLALNATEPPAAFLVAHRGASAYAPEHTLDAYRLAIEQGADYVEPDLCLTKDKVLVISHDPTLERTTDVEAIFPDRFTSTTNAATGAVTKHWYIEDFTLAEIKQLDHGAWFGAKFAGRKMLTFQEGIDVVKGRAGLFPELKTPARLRAKGFDIEGAVAEILQKNNLVGTMYKGRPAVYLQAFEEDSLRRVAALLPTVPRTFLIGTADMSSRWLSAEGLKQVRAFATAVSPSNTLINADPAIVTRAHAEGLIVVPYTFSMRPKTDIYQDAPPEYRQQIEAAMRGLPDTPAALTADMKKFIDVYKVDGLFTDNPDLFPHPAVGPR